MILTSRGEPRAVICVPAAASAPVRFGAGELQRYIRRISGAGLAIVDAPAGTPETALLLAPLGEAPPPVTPADAAGLKADGYRLRARADGLVLAGANPRGALYACYDLLERLGCRWFFPGEDGEFIPARADLDLPALDVTEEPAFRVRGWTEDASATAQDPVWVDAFVRDAALFLDWFTKNRMNDYRTLAVMRERLAREVADRDLLPTYGGGHSVPHLLPRELFATRPELFRMDSAGQRVPHGNVCVSNPETVRLCAETILEWAGAHPEAPWYLVMGEDIWGGAWCSCDRCRPYSASEQNWILINGVQEHLDQRGSSCTAAYAAYRDTLRMDLKQVTTHPRARIGYAPRERSYGHAIDDPANERNRWFLANLLAWRKLHRGPIGVTDYYHDCILFYTYGMPTTRIIRDDLRCYARHLDLEAIRSYMMGRFSWRAYNVSMYVFARLAWNPEADMDGLINELAHLHYGPAAAAIQGYWREFENGMRKVQTYGEVETLPATCDPFIEQLMGDFTAAESHLDQAERHLTAAVAAAGAGGPYADRVDLERRIFTLTRAAVSGQREHLQGNYWYAVARRDVERNEISDRFGRAPRPVRGIGYALAHLGRAAELWRAHSRLCHELDPEPHSYFVKAPGGGPQRLNRAHILLIERQMDEVRGWARRFPEE